ncbi:MAG: 50S ribosomal protein L13, partial [Acidobacteriota bacterium]
MKTYLPSKEDADRKWLVLDAENKVLGRLASRAAVLLMGKSKGCYTQFLDTGDFVIIVNASKVRLTGKKLDQKMYRRHTQHPGGLREISARDLMASRPERVIERAVHGMLPKTKLGRAMRKKLKVYADGDHPHKAQKPVTIE